MDRAWSDQTGHALAEGPSGVRQRRHEQDYFAAATVPGVRTKYPQSTPPKEPGLVLDGTREVQNTSASSAWRSTRSVPGAAQPAQGDRWATDTNGKALTPERPVKANDDAVDALRYGLRGQHRKGGRRKMGG